MDVLERQLASAEQEAVLRGLALSGARPGCRFLEVGSWCGDSSLILATVARDFGGQLFCVDWWKGNSGTELSDVASQQDVFGFFWRRMCHAGLEDCVIPLRGSSDAVLPILKENSFQMIFLDADHRYQQVKRDIAAAIPLLSRDKGILSGHDCDGMLADYDADFLEAGQDMDCYESVHCGVVLAVGEAFAHYSLQHSIWSVRALEHAGAWEPTGLQFPTICNRRQAPPPTIASTQEHNLVRYGRHVYAIPHGLDSIDLTDSRQRTQAGIITAPTLAETHRLASEAEAAAEREQIERERRLRLTPTLREEGYHGFNIVAFADRYYALAQCVGPVDIPSMSPDDIALLKRQSRLFIGDSHAATRRLIEEIHAGR
jgi:hypothetical protein